MYFLFYFTKRVDITTKVGYVLSTYPTYAYRLGLELGMTIYILAEMNIFLFASFRTYQF